MPPQALLSCSLRLNGLWVRRGRDTLAAPRSHPASRLAAPGELFFGARQMPLVPRQLPAVMAWQTHHRNSPKFMSSISRGRHSPHSVAASQHGQPSSVSQACQDQKSP